MSKLFDSIMEIKLKKEIERLVIKYNGIIKENEELEERINKAIEYLEFERYKSKILVGLYENKYTKEIFDKLLEILRGDKK